MRIETLVLLVVGVVILTAFCAVSCEKHTVLVKETGDEYITEDWNIGFWFSPWCKLHRTSSPLKKTGPHTDIVVRSWSWVALLVSAGAFVAAHRTSRTSPPAGIVATESPNADRG